MRSTTTTLCRATQSAAVLLICLLGSKATLGATYTDATGDGSFITTFPHLDIASVEVTNTATHISFTINLVGDPIATNWGEYQISIDSILGAPPAGMCPPIDLTRCLVAWTIMSAVGTRVANSIAGITEGVFGQETSKPTTHRVIFKSPPRRQVR